MTMFKERVKLPEIVIRKMPWKWLNETMGPRNTGWDLVYMDWEDDDGCTYLLLKTTEDKTQFILTWM